ncbi:hypothetical protein GBA52_028319 [Prunus armeniaca]|nr:hypothetical protein GBA52_028319 [Prunus armeniaca]
MKKGGPRTSFYELCKKQQWRRPDFESSETKSRTPIDFGEGSSAHFSSFVSKITLHIPNFGDIECTGDARPDKKVQKILQHLPCFMSLSGKANLSLVDDHVSILPASFMNNSRNRRVVPFKSTNLNMKQLGCCLSGNLTAM